MTGNLNDLTEREMHTYWWNYGEIGQKIVEKSKDLKLLLKKDFKIMDGHAHNGPPESKFRNLPSFAHLDIIIYNPSKREVKAICEVKTTKNSFKKEFKINGECEKFMTLARRKKIPLFFSVVRLKDLMPIEIIKKRGYSKVLKEYLKDNSKYSIEFYSEDKFFMEDGFFKIK